jgi:hypothetical protein
VPTALGASWTIQPPRAAKGLLRLPAGGFTAAGRVTGVSLDRFSERHLSRF